jgi:L-rhamnose mutarotase
MTALFGNQQRLPVARILELHGPSLYSFSELRERRVSPMKSGAYQAAITQNFQLASGLGGYNAKIVGVRTRSVPQSWELGTPNQTSLNELEIASERSLNFVLQEYESRREEWPPEFLSLLKKKAKEYLARSTYLIIEMPNGTTQRPVYGALRLIAAQNGRVPMEDYLGITIDVGTKLKVEPGNFAIYKDFNKDVWPELLLQLLSQMSREIEIGRENHYVTYADQYSLMLYSRLGFKPIAKYGKILKDGIWWTPMEASQSDLNLILSRFLKRPHSEVSQAVDLRNQSLRENPRAHIFEMQNGFRLRLSREENRVHFFYNIQAGSPSVPIGAIPLEALPLREGYKFSDFNHEVSYANGLLQFRRRQGDGVSRLRVSPGLDSIRDFQSEKPDINVTF